MKVIILIITISLSINNLYSQKLRIPLKQKIGFGPFEPEAGSVLFSPPENHPLFNAFNKFFLHDSYLNKEKNSLNNDFSCSPNSGIS